MIIRDYACRFVAAKRIKISASRVEVAEALAVMEGCCLASQIGLARIVVKSNSKETILCLNNSLIFGRYESYPILQKVLQLGHAFQFRHWSWIPRSANRPADWLTSF